MTRHRSVSSWLLLGCALSGVAGLASFAGAQVARPGVVASNGPDVLVGRLYGNTDGTGRELLIHATNGLSGSSLIHAYSVGTYSCNRGNERLAWFSGDNRHPVIGQNLYRLNNGRFEHIGQSWLKHGFLALQGTECSASAGDPQNGAFPWASCAANPDGTYLGVGCSDPYDASLNSGQSSAGPKSEINASTGVFPYPRSFTGFPSGDPGTSGNVSRRTQVKDADLITGARYYVEGQYVTADDAAGGNNKNNASWREVDLEADKNLKLLGSTVREQPAIAAWQIADPTVKLAQLDVPGDGRFWIGWKVTANAGGTWTYEYAVHNLSSHRSGASFKVPIAAGAVITAIGFHDVDYHSGEELVYDQTDWTGAVVGNSVTWTSPTPSGSLQNNAIRWGTLYNFRFTANQAPAQAAASLGLLRAGSGDFLGMNDVTVAVDTPGGADVGSVPINDTCASAVPMSGFAAAFSTQRATSSGPDECTFSGSAAISSDVWYSWTYPSTACAGSATIQTCGSSFDTKLAIYSGGCPSAPGTALACNDDSSAACGTTGIGATNSAVTIAVTPGQAYLIRVGGFTTSKGNGVITIIPPNCAPVTGACCNPTNGSCTIAGPTSCTGTGGNYQGDSVACSTGLCPAPPAPANDLCANAQWIADGVPITSTNINAQTDYSGQLAQGCTATLSQGLDVWYKYLPTVTGNIRVTTNTVGTGSTSFDTVLTVFSGTCAGTILACNDDSGSPNLSSNIPALAVTAGQLYLIRVAGYGGNPATGTFTLRVIGGGGTIPTPPANDNCADRQGVGNGSINFDTTNATTDGIAPVGCSPGQIDNDIWFNYPAQTTGTLTVSTCGSSFDTRIAVYATGECNQVASTFVACNDNFACPGGGTTQSQLTVNIIQGQSYTLRIGGTGTTGRGPGILTLSSQTTLGSCCDSGNNCHVYTASDCALGSGTFGGVGSTCGPNTCLPAQYQLSVTVSGTGGSVTSNPEGIFCGAACASNFNSGTNVTLTATPRADAVFLGWSGACTGLGSCTLAMTSTRNTTATFRCKADHNNTGSITVQDILDFVSDWLAGNPAADYNGGGVAVQDLLDFFTAWLNGGC